MIDDGATDWKVTQVWTFCLVDQKLIDLAQLIAMNVEEADKLNIKDMASLESAMPGIAQAVQKFFRVYKVVGAQTHTLPKRSLLVVGSSW